MGVAVTPPHLGHVAVAASDPQRLAAFYEDLLGLEIVRETKNPQVGAAILLSGDPRIEDHELVLLANPAARHLAFRVGSLEQLRMLYRRAKERGLEVPYALDSGVARGFFVRDPEGNALEIYLRVGNRHRDTPPFSDPDEIDRLIRGG